MKAIVFTEYGSPDVLHLQEMPTPTPGENEILVQVRAAAVNYGDLTARRFAHLTLREFNMPAPLYLPARMTFGWNKPKLNILGSEFAGDVSAVGSGVTRFRPGDAVFAYVGQRMGANAEYICISAAGAVAPKPTNLTYAEAATLPYGGIMATSLLQKAKLQPGQSILINGASGGIGAMAVLLAKDQGAVVTGVCGTPRLDFVRSLGADKVIDYTRQDFTDNGETYDVIFDVLGKTSFSRSRHALKPDGILLFASFKGRAIFDMLWTAALSRKKVICALADERAAHLDSVKDLAEMGKVKANIDRVFPLHQAAAAHRYMESGDRKGPVILTIP